MTDLTTKTAQSLHAEWCRHMWKRGWHGPLDKRTNKYDAKLVSWSSLPVTRQQEYLAMAKAVLPEIEKEFGKAIAEARLDEHKRCCVCCTRGYGDDGWSRRCSDRVSLEETLRDRCLEELKK